MLIFDHSPLSIGQLEVLLANMISRRSIFLFGALFLLSVQCALAEDQDFKLSGEPAKANAIVSDDHFDLNVHIGVKEDYPKLEKFNLVVSGCFVKVEAGNGPGGLSYAFTGPTDPNAASIIDLKTITIKNSTGITFHGPSNSTISIQCPVNFGNKTGDNYYVLIELSGEVPKVFELSSKTIKMGNPPSDNKADGAEMGLGEIIGIAAGCFVALLLICSIVGFVIYHRCYKKKALQKQKAREQLATAKSVEALPMPSDVSDPKVKQGEPKTDSNKEKPKEKTKKSKKESDPKSDQKKDKKEKKKNKKSKNESDPTSERKSERKSEMKSGMKSGRDASARSSRFNKPKDTAGNTKSGPYIRMDEVISDRED